MSVKSKKGLPWALWQAGQESFIAADVFKSAAESPILTEHAKN
jgi:hypothetical protein